MKEAWFHDRHGACEKAGLDPDTVQLDEEDYTHSNMTMSLSVKLVGSCTYTSMRAERKCVCTQGLNSLESVIA